MDNTISSAPRSLSAAQQQSQADADAAAFDDVIFQAGLAGAKVAFEEFQRLAQEAVAGDS